MNKDIMQTISYMPQELGLKILLLNLFIGLILGFLLKLHYDKFGSALSGKQELSKTLPFLVLIVCLIISIVKSSLALSLGLVGALSIVRFRTPIKEPEELVYIFMAIATGLGLGANQTSATILGFFIILLSISLIRIKSLNRDAQAIYLTVNLPKAANESNSNKIIDILDAHCSVIEIRRLDSNADSYNMTFLIEMTSVDKIFEITNLIEKEHPSATVTFIDQSRIPGV